jgi:acetamidase/formamidase
LTASREHWLPGEAVHHRWDKTLAPALAIRSGDVVHLQTREVSGGQITLGAPAAVAASLDTSKTYPLAGPILVEGALPGDVLEIEMLELRPGDWGWTAIIPGRGLLANDFDQPYIRYFALDDPHRVEMRPGITIPVAPFCGTIGVAPDRSESLPARPPQEGGGNIDDRRLTEGSKLYLPVLVQGALLSVGDCHAAQGDGEVCVTGLECDMQVTLRISSLHGRPMPAWTHQVVTSGGPAETASPQICMAASGPDLMENARVAIRQLIGWLEQRHQLSREDAYVLCSLAADLRIGQVVNAPNWTVSACLPLTLFDATRAAEAINRS